MASTNKSPYTIATPAALNSANSITGNSGSSTGATASAQPSILSEGSRANQLGTSASSGSGSAMTKPRTDTTAPINPDTQWMLTNGYTAKEGNTTLSGPGTVMAAQPSGQQTAAALERYTAKPLPLELAPTDQREQSSRLEHPGEYAIRSTLEQRGISPDRIGWNNTTKSVTIDGKDVITPSDNRDGTTYTDEATINKLTNNAYAANGNSLVAARQYIEEMGLGGSVHWDPDTGNVNMAGYTLQPAYVTSDGIAYIPKSQIDAAAAAYKQQTGQLMPQEVTDAYEDRYGDKYATALNALLNRGEFSYDPESDIVYQSYRDQYTRNAEAALRATLNNANSDAGGSTGARAGEALAAYYNQMSKLNDVIPTLYSDAYTRYQGETERLRNNLSDTMSVGNDFYDKYHTQYTDARNAALTDREYFDNQQQQIWQNNETALNNATSRAYQEYLTAGQGLQNEQQRMYNSYYPQMAEGQIKSQTLANAATQLDNTLTGSYSFGSYPIDSETEALLQLYGYTKQSDGTYTDRNGHVREPWYYEGQYTDAMGKIQNNLELERQRALMQLGL